MQSPGDEELYYLCNVAYWHETDTPTALRDIRSRGQSGKHLLAWSFSGFDPNQTLARVKRSPPAASSSNICSTARRYSYSFPDGLILPRRSAAIGQRVSA
jgi:hypothetical protein